MKRLNHFIHITLYTCKNTIKKSFTRKEGMKKERLKLKSEEKIGGMKMDLVGGIKFIVHEASDDASFADGLIAQEHELVFGQRGYHRHAGRSESQFTERKEEEKEERERESESSRFDFNSCLYISKQKKPPTTTKTGFWTYFAPHLLYPHFLSCYPILTFPKIFHLLV